MVLTPDSLRLGSQIERHVKEWQGGRACLPIVTLYNIYGATCGSLFVVTEGMRYDEHAKNPVYILPVLGAISSLAQSKVLAQFNLLALPCNDTGNCSSSGFTYGLGCLLS
jgi:hypothetical protein